MIHFVTEKFFLSCESFILSLIETWEGRRFADVTLLYLPKFSDAHYRVRSNLSQEDDDPPAI